MRTVPFVDDETFWVESYIDQLRAHNLKVLCARTLAEAKQIISANHSKIDIVVTDLMMPPGEGEDSVETHGGYRSGMALIRWIKQNYPALPVIALTADPNESVQKWFLDVDSALISKVGTLPYEFADYVDSFLAGQPRQLKTFIVHGHDEQVKYALKNYLQNVLRLPEPTILHEQPNLGRTILEKFEDHASQADVIFVLLTQDDRVWEDGQPDAVKRRARQNVVFELGYFLGNLGRKRGRVILLHKGPLELPSDISGLVYIDITNGIESAGELIRREIEVILKTT